MKNAKDSEFINNCNTVTSSQHFLKSFRNEGSEQEDCMKTTMDESTDSGTDNCPINLPPEKTEIELLSPTEYLLGRVTRDISDRWVTAMINCLDYVAASGRAEKVVISPPQVTVYVRGKDSQPDNKNETQTCSSIDTIIIERKTPDTEG